MNKIKIAFKPENKAAFSIKMPADLGESVVLNDSEIQGVGLFAKRDITAGEFLQYTHVYHPKYEDWVSLDPNYKYNHSAENENCEVVVDEKASITYDDPNWQHPRAPAATSRTICAETPSFKLVALKNILENEELLVNYTKNELLEQPKEGWKK